MSSRSTVRRPPSCPLRRVMFRLRRPLVRWRVPRRTGASGRARKAVRSTLADWGWDEDRVAPAVLVLSELLTNAQLYTEGDVALALRRTRRGARLSVTDTDPRMPTRRDTGPEHEGGFGLHILDTITTDWGVRTHRGGKTVWADIDAAAVAHRPRRSSAGARTSSIRRSLVSRLREGSLATRRRARAGLPVAEVWRRAGAIGSTARAVVSSLVRLPRRRGSGLMLVHLLATARPAA
ncbi:ATP-binding protein [Embleya sp. NPDC050493]|uniref:ATP-binding protein n=1 Tax=Embleya sp. NPDC050493 TaxID=3363989 RepID=UPI0037970022